MKLTFLPVNLTQQWYILKKSNGQQRMNTILKLQGRSLVMSCKLLYKGPSPKIWRTLALTRLRSRKTRILIHCYGYCQRVHMKVTERDSIQFCRKWSRF